MEDFCDDADEIGVLNDEALNSWRGKGMSALNAACQSSLSGEEGGALVLRVCYL